MTDGALTNVLKEEETIEWVWHNVSHAPNYSNRCKLYFWLGSGNVSVFEKDKSDERKYPKNQTVIMFSIMAM